MPSEIETAGDAGIESPFRGSVILSPKDEARQAMLEHKLAEYQARLRAVQESRDYQAPELAAELDRKIADSTAKVRVLQTLLTEGRVDHDSLAAQFQADNTSNMHAYENAFGVIQTYAGGNPGLIRGGTGLQE